MVTGMLLQQWKLARGGKLSRQARRTEQYASFMRRCKVAENAAYNAWHFRPCAVCCLRRLPVPVLWHCGWHQAVWDLNSYMHIYHAPLGLFRWPKWGEAAGPWIVYSLFAAILVWEEVRSNSRMEKQYCVARHSHPA